MSTDPAGAIVDLHLAATAADIARATPGVLRLQPGLWGLVQQLSRELWEHVTGDPYPDLGGVEAELRDRVAHIDITLVADGHRPAAAVAADVQHAVAATVTASFDITSASVAVHVCAIGLPG